ncbi:MAG TPA: galactokinase family protein [Thermoleophilaceae bacterium]|nr:galactokinase family protein [Thermoleophilaceae bacterium]
MSSRAFAPGRVNLIGEHTDYNGGLALPFAIDHGITVSVVPGPPGDEPYRDAVAAELGGDPPAVEIESDLPAGAGLSSSAALCAALALAIGGDGDRLELARLCQRVENDRMGANTGLLDQIAVLMAPPGGALLIDFADLSTEPVRLELGEWRLAVLDSGERHAHATSGYNERRAECEQGDPRRLRHVESENERVREAVDALAARDMPRLGALLDASHASLRDDYEVSTPAVEATRDRMLAAGAAGARIVGGGFGGSVLGLFGPDAQPPAGALAVQPGKPACLLPT